MTLVNAVDSIASVMGNVRLASDISDSIAHALNCRFVCLKEGKTVARVFQSSLDAAIRNIESHPRGKLFCRLIEFGPHTPDEPKAETSDGKTVLSDQHEGQPEEADEEHWPVVEAPSQGTANHEIRRMMPDPVKTAICRAR